jgi:NAD-dependent dihydropyrimidine dehydrogenase PreA subunit
MSASPTSAAHDQADCKERGLLVPRIDRRRCEGKQDCVRVCPYDVFEMRVVPAEDRAALGLLGRLKLKVHGGRQAYLRAPDDCHACGLCVTNCPERAITLVAR